MKTPHPIWQARLLARVNLAHGGGGVVVVARVHLQKGSDVDRPQGAHFFLAPVNVVWLCLNLHSGFFMFGRKLVVKPCDIHTLKNFC